MHLRNKLIALSGFVVILLIWIALYISKIYNPLLVPSPFEVLIVFLKFLISKDFLLNFFATLTRVLISFVVSAIIGVFFGLIVGFYNLANKSTEPLIDFIRSIPAIALFPLFILFFGVGDISRLLVAICLGIPIILISTKYGVINSSKLRKNLAKIYKIKKFRLFHKIILPEASPYIFTGLRVSASFIIIITIVTEMMLGTNYGLGQLLVTNQYQFETAAIFAIIFVLGIIGFSLNFGFNKIENKIFHWR